MNLKTTYFTALYENGALRRIKSGNVEVLRMVYSAVRDRNWGTVNPEVVKIETKAITDGFQIKLWITYQNEDINFYAFYSITGRSNCLKFEMEGEAKSDFLANRIGFCALHPVKECSGKPFTVFHPDGSSEKYVFPKLVSPHQPAKNIKAMEWKPCDNIRAELQFSGDVFEMEDQRNWTDSSYKTYCRPLEWPFPYLVKAGQIIRQKIEMKIEAEPILSVDKPDFVSFKIDESRTFKLPEIGICATSRREPLTKNEATDLSQFQFDHLRAEIKLFEPNWKIDLLRSAREANYLNISMYLIIYFSENVEEELISLRNEVVENQFKVKYVLPIGKNHLPVPSEFNKIFHRLKTVFPQAKIGSGVNAYFAELNRNRPQSKKTEFISFAICPQVHAFDETTLIENLEGQKYTVESAKALFRGQPVFVSPVTLKQRFNVVATSEQPESKFGELPYQVDERQNTIFAAQWFLGSLKFLSEANTDLVTYFETVGWRGFIQGNFNPPVPEKFSARKGDIFPIFSILQEFRGYGKVIFSESSSPLEVDGIVLLKESSEKNDKKVLISNFTPVPKKIKLSGFQPDSQIKKFSGEIIANIRDCVIEIPASEIVIIEN